MKILSMEEAIKKYGLSREYLTRLCNTKGAPVLPRVKGAPYRIIAEEFEEWLKSRRR